jgi:ubiquinone/menaquinone biosynthesis C-methylase UbiE
MSLRELYDREVLGRILDAVMPDTMELRHQLLRSVAGRVVEIGFGAGANLPAYPETVEEIVAVEPSRGLLERARPAIARSGRRVTCLEASASRPLALEAGVYDAVVITFVLCSARSVGAILHEARRLLRPGAPLFIAEHVVSTGQMTRAIQKTIQPVWSAILGGCNPGFDARQALRAAGFDDRAVHDVALALPYPVSTGIAGVATIAH